MHTIFGHSTMYNEAMYAKRLTFEDDFLRISYHYERVYKIYIQSIEVYI